LSSHGLIPWPAVSRAVSEVFIAVALGFHIRNYIGFSPRFEPGIKFSLTRVLRLGIILLGARLSLQAVISIGASALLLVLACVAFALTLAYLLGRAMRIPARLAALIGVGTAICGNSAIIATAPVIDARDEDVSYAVATITAFGTLAVILYPAIGFFTGMTDRVFGMWAGTAILDTSQVVAAGAAFTTAARDIATVVKLVRNTLMVPLILLIGIVYTRAQKRSNPSVKVSVSKAIPWFVLGFLGMSVLRTIGNALGIMPVDVSNPGSLTAAAWLLNALDEITKFAILMALAAIGLSTDAASIRRTGVKPLALGFAVGGALALFSLLIIRLIG
jgi:uncharacterized integral membrane protein (TIGR00698 family)